VQKLRVETSHIGAGKNKSGPNQVVVEFVAVFGGGGDDDDDDDDDDGGGDGDEIQTSPHLMKTSFILLNANVSFFLTFMNCVGNCKTVLINILLHFQFFLNLIKKL
jgi:hypothetical protein